MELTQQALRGILAKILLGSDTESNLRYIVPKQGNWYNPQDRDKLSTFVAFILRKSSTVAMPYYKNETGPNRNTSVSLKKGMLEMQIVGDASEVLADSISHWLHRADVLSEFNTVNCQLMADEFGAYEVSNFSQAGLNTVLAYNVRCPLQWISIIDASQDQITESDITGDLIIP